MVTRRDRFQKSLQDVSNEDWIFPVSLALILLAFIVSEFNYYFIDQAMTLFFYAVLVQIWTQMGAGRPRSRTRDAAHIEFMANAIAAVVIGYALRWFVTWTTGDIIAVQSLALATVISRLYINMKGSNSSSLKAILRYDQPVDRYLVLVPCTVAFFAPVLVHELGLYSISFTTRESFLGVVTMSILVGVGLYYHEQH